MDINISAQSIKLLELIANSIHDRPNTKPDSLVIFTLKEISVVEEWLHELLKEIDE